MKEGRSNHVQLNQSSKNAIFFQPKLSINAPNDIYEQEADAVAEKVIQSKPVIQADTFFKPAIISPVQRKCAHCEEEEKLQRKEENGNETETSSEFENYVDGLNNSGTALPSSSKSFFESRIGYDFSNVKIHTDSVAAKSAQSINALAYTSGNNIVFNQNQFQPGTTNGDKLIAHELTHVVQQSNQISTKRIQRVRLAQAHTDDECNRLIGQIRSTSAYRAATPAVQQLTEDIINMTRSKPFARHHYYLGRLIILFNTPEASASTVTTETNQATTDAVTAERTRLASHAGATNVNLEENASADPARAGRWVGIRGQYGGGTYYVDRASANDIVIRAKVFLEPRGTGTPANVQSIRSMEDGIEKAASTRGYLVDIQFVNDASDPDTFTVGVDPSNWETATNWSGGSPVGFAHELHHMFAFRLDRYDYIQSHSANASMHIPDRLHWFREELTKPDGYNDPTSLMSGASHPNDSDVCITAGLNEAACRAARAASPPP